MEGFVAQLRERFGEKRIGFAGELEFFRLGKGREGLAEGCRTISFALATADICGFKKWRSGLGLDPFGQISIAGSMHRLSPVGKSQLAAIRAWHPSEGGCANVAAALSARRSNVRPPWRRRRNHVRPASADRPRMAPSSING